MLNSDELNEEKKVEQNPIPENLPENPLAEIPATEDDAGDKEESVENPAPENLPENPVAEIPSTEEPAEEKEEIVEAPATENLPETPSMEEVPAEETEAPALEQLSESPVAEIAPLEDLPEDKELHDNDAYQIDIEHEEEINYASLPKEELVELIEKAAKSDDLAEAGKIAREIKPLLEAVFSEEYEQALNQFLEEGNEKDNFSMKPDALKQRFYDAFRSIQQKRSDYRDRVEQEKLRNLELKRNILQQLKDITETDETADSLEKVKVLQGEWKKIRVVPKEDLQQLWDAYRFYMDKFYDNLSINNELKELDRKKNLEVKIELCMKVDQLMEEPSIKKSMIMLNKFHDEWKNTGPVPREYSEEIWTRFKGASDRVYEQKNAQMEELREKRKQNLELKTALCEKLEMIVNDTYDKPKAWIEKTQEIATLFEEWKKVGPVPKENNEKVWNRFKDLKNNFYRQKNIFFKTLNKDKTDNLHAKVALCEKAEALKESDDWNKITNELIRLQGDWKKIGPVSEKQSDEVWKRFRAACDHFFARKEDHFKGQKEEQEVNLDKKKSLIEKLKSLQEKEEADNVFADLKEIQKSWSETGFVPIKFKTDLQKEFSDLVDHLYKKFRKNAEEMNSARLKDHYNGLSQSDEGKKRLQGEERRIKEKIRFLRSDIETLENNIGFFSKSKTAGPLIDGIKDKITKTNVQVEKLEKELKVIKSMY